jgi:hypothetical protein
MQVTLQVTTDAIMTAIADRYSRKILLSAIPAAKSVQTISKENGIPLSSCYRKVNEMVQAGSLVVERIIIPPSGKRYELYRSCFKAITLTIDSGRMTVDGNVNEEVADKLRAKSSSMQYGRN